MKKLTVVHVAIIILSVIFAVMASSTDGEILNAAINPQNGDIAIAYVDYSGRTGVQKIALFNKDGEVLCSTSILDIHHAGLAFDNDILYVEVGKSAKKLYRYNRNGEEISLDETSGNPVFLKDDFEDWKWSPLKRRYSLDGYEYVYTLPTAFRRAKLTIKNGERICELGEIR